MKFVPKIYSKTGEKDVFLCIYVTFLSLPTTPLPPPPSPILCVHTKQGGKRTFSSVKREGAKNSYMPHSLTDLDLI